MPPRFWVCIGKISKSSESVQWSNQLICGNSVSKKSEATQRRNWASCWECCCGLGVLAGLWPEGCQELVLIKVLVWYRSYPAYEVMQQSLWIHMLLLIVACGLLHKILRFAALLPRIWVLWVETVTPCSKWPGIRTEEVLVILDCSWSGKKALLVWNAEPCGALMLNLKLKVSKLTWSSVEWQQGCWGRRWRMPVEVVLARQQLLNVGIPEGKPCPCVFGSYFWRRINSAHLNSKAFLQCPSNCSEAEPQKDQSGWFCVRNSLALKTIKVVKGSKDNYCARRIAGICKILGSRFCVSDGTLSLVGFVCLSF